MKRATNATITTRILSTTGLKQPKVCRTCFKTTDVFHYIDQRDGKESVFIREKIQSCVPEMVLIVFLGSFNRYVLNTKFVGFICIRKSCSLQ